MQAIIRSLLIVTGVPALLAVIYFGFLASDIYVSEARFAIRSAKAGSSGGGLAAILSTPIISSGGNETLVVSDFAKSQDMLNQIQKRLDLRTHYSDRGIDVLSRLPNDATQEEMLAYFRQQVNLMHDRSSDVITLTTRAFDPVTAQQLASLVIELSEQLVNRMSERMEEDALVSAREEVEHAASKVRDASASVVKFRNSNTSLNPAAESSALMGIVSGLETKLIEARTELSEKGAFMRNDSPLIVSLENRINALERQLKLEKGRLVGDDKENMGGLIEVYQPLILNQELAQQQYASALSSLEMARIEAQRKKQYLVTFIQPSLPEEAVEPHRINRILTVIIFSLLAYMIGALMWSALKDHIGR